MYNSQLSTISYNISNDTFNFWSRPQIDNFFRRQSTNDTKIQV